MKQKKNTRALAQMSVDKNNYFIRATEHSIERMNERKIDEYVVSGIILSLGRDRLSKLQKTKKKFVIIDDEKNVSIIAAFKKNTIIIITVIDKSNIWVKKGTSIINLK